MQDQEKTQCNGDVDLRYFADKLRRSSEAVTPARRDVNITLDLNSLRQTSKSQGEIIHAKST